MYSHDRGRDAASAHGRLKWGEQIVHLNRTRSLTKFDAMVLTMMNAALKGDAKAQASVIALLRSVGMTDEAPEASHSEPLTADDAAVIADYLRRHSAALAPAEPPRGNEQATVGTPPPDAGAAS